MIFCEKFENKFFLDKSSKTCNIDEGDFNNCKLDYLINAEDDSRCTSVMYCQKTTEDNECLEYERYYLLNMNTMTCELNYAIEEEKDKFYIIV